MNKQHNNTKIFVVFVVLLLLSTLIFTSCGTNAGGYSAEKQKNAESKEYTIDDIKDATIASLLGSIESEYLSTHYPDTKNLEYNTAADALAALRTKKVDFFTIQSSMLDIYEKQTGDVENIHFELFPTHAGFGFKKGNEELVNEVNGVIKEYEENGKMDELRSHWADVYNYVIKDVPVNSTGKTIVVGTSGELEPFNFYVNNQLVGADIEIIGNILYDLGYQVEYKCMQFGALMPALESGKIDIIASHLTITDERKESIDFSDVYFSEYSSLAVYKGNTGGGSILTSIKEGLYNNFIKEDRYKMVIDGLGMTAALAVTAGIFGTLLGIILCFMSRSRMTVIRGIKKVYSAIIEGTPIVVVLLIVCYVILGKVNANGIIIGMLAFGMVFGNDVCGAIENGLNNIDRGQYEAIKALGYPERKGFIKLIMPQLMRNFLPIYRGSFTSMIKATAIAGYVAVQDLTKAGDLIRSRTFDAFIPLIVVAIIYFIIIWLVTLFIRYFENGEKRIRRKREVRL